MAGRNPLLVFLTYLTLLLPCLALPSPDNQQRTKAANGDFFLGVPISNPSAKNVVPNKYIVVYNNTFNSTAIAAHQASVMATIAKRNIGKRSPHTGKTLSTAVNTFAMGKWRAMALEADDKMMNEIFNADEVSYIEQDAYVNLSAVTTETGAPSGLVRLSSASAVSSGASNGTTYTFDASGGSGITAYVVDTGIRVTHSEFEGRATFGANFVNSVVSSTLLGHEAVEGRIGMMVRRIRLTDILPEHRRKRPRQPRRRHHRRQDLRRGQERQPDRRQGARRGRRGHQLGRHCGDAVW
jgi:subtilisin family serine protease